MRFHIIRNALIENVGKYQSCMVSKLRIIWKQTVEVHGRAPIVLVAHMAAVGDRSVGPQHTCTGAM